MTYTAVHHCHEPHGLTVRTYRTWGIKYGVEVREFRGLKNAVCAFDLMSKTRPVHATIVRVGYKMIPDVVCASGDDLRRVVESVFGREGFEKIEADLLCFLWFGY